MAIIMLYKDVIGAWTFEQFVVIIYFNSLCGTIIKHFKLVYMFKDISTVASLGPGVNYVYFAFAK